MTNLYTMYKCIAAPAGITKCHARPLRAHGFLSCLLLDLATKAPQETRGEANQPTTNNQQTTTSNQLQTTDQQPCNQQPTTISNIILHSWPESGSASSPVQEIPAPKALTSGFLPNLCHYKICFSLNYIITVSSEHVPTKSENHTVVHPSPHPNFLQIFGYPLRPGEPDVLSWLNVHLPTTLANEYVQLTPISRF